MRIVTRRAKLSRVIRFAFTVLLVMIWFLAMRKAGRAKSLMFICENEPSLPVCGKHCCPLVEKLRAAADTAPREKALESLILKVPVIRDLIIRSPLDGLNPDLKSSYVSRLKSSGDCFRSESGGWSLGPISSSLSSGDNKKMVSSRLAFARLRRKDISPDFDVDTCRFIDRVVSLKDLISRRRYNSVFDVVDSFLSSGILISRSASDEPA